MKSDFYRPIKGFPNYRVGRDGSIWRLRVWIPHGKNKIGWEPWKRLNCKTVTTPNGRQYKRISLRGKGFYRGIGVHILVLETFIGPRPPNLEACHWDDNGLNNWVENLRWDTRSANKRDSVRNGIAPLGERHPNSKLTKKQVLLIRKLFKSGKSIKVLAKRFHVCSSNIGQIVRRTAWSWLNE